MFITIPCCKYLSEPHGVFVILSSLMCSVFTTVSFSLFFPRWYRTKWSSQGRVSLYAAWWLPWIRTVRACRSRYWPHATRGSVWPLGFLKGRVMARCCDSSDWMLGSQLGVTIMIGDQFSLIVLLWDLGGFIKLHDFSLAPWSKYPQTSQIWLSTLVAHSTTLPRPWGHDHWRLSQDRHCHCQAPFAASLEWFCEPVGWFESLHKVKAADGLVGFWSYSILHVCFVFHLTNVVQIT